MTGLDCWNVYWSGYSPPIDHLLTVLGDFHAQHSLWHSGTTNSCGNQLADSVSVSSFAVLNTDSPTSHHLVRMENPHGHLPILIGLKTTAASSPAWHNNAHVSFTVNKASKRRVVHYIQDCIPVMCLVNDL